eukprot:3559102-Prymnesium_polylepis.1
MTCRFTRGVAPEPPFPPRAPCRNLHVAISALSAQSAGCSITVFSGIGKGIPPPLYFLLNPEGCS